MDNLFAPPDPDFPQKRPRPAPARRIFAVLGSLAALAACLGLVIVLLGGEKDPRAALKAAFNATQRENLKHTEALAKQIPALELLEKASGWPRQNSDAALTFKSIAGVEEAQRINALLGGSTLSVRSELDRAQGTAQTTAMLSMLGREFFGLYGYLSPQALAFGLPGLTDTTLAVDLTSLAEDFAATTWYDPDVAEMLETMRESLLSWTESMAESDSRPAAGLRAAWDALLDTGVYTREGGVFTVTLAGEDVRAFVLEAAWQLGQSGLGGQYTRERFLSEGEQALPPIPVTAVFEVGSDGTIARFEISAPAFDLPSAEMFAVELSLSGRRQDGRGEIVLRAAWDDWADDACVLEGTFALETDGGRWMLTGELGMSDGYYEPAASLRAELNPDGSLVLEAGLTDGADDGSLYVTVRGSVTGQDEEVVIDLPECVLDYRDSRNGFTVALGLRQSVTRQQAAIVPDRSFTALFSMTEEALMVLVNEVVQGLEGMFDGF